MLLPDPLCPVFIFVVREEQLLASCTATRDDTRPFDARDAEPTTVSAPGCDPRFRSGRATVYEEGADRYVPGYRDGECSGRRSGLARWWEGRSPATWRAAHDHSAGYEASKAQSYDTDS